MPTEPAWKTVPVTEHVGTNDIPNHSSAVNSDELPPAEGVTCPEDSLVLSNYPWKKTLRVKVQKLSALETDIWCGNIPGYYQYVPDPDLDTLQVTPLLVHGYGSKSKGTAPPSKSVKTEVKTEELDEDITDQEPAKLIEHANALIHGMRSLATDPVNKRQSLKLTPKGKKSTVPVETDVPSALEQLYNSPMDKLALVGKSDTANQPKYSRRGRTP